MGRRSATFWHATSSVAAGVLYFFFVLPRWPELMGDTSHALGTAARIIAGVLIALAALAGGVHTAAVAEAGVRHTRPRVDAAHLVGGWPTW